jgi:hypothetical protein
MNPDDLSEFKTKDVLRKRLAKLMAHDCFRNTRLEDFHSGIYPSSKTGDYPDVKVVSLDAMWHAYRASPFVAQNCDLVPTSVVQALLNFRKQRYDCKKL